MTLSKSIQFHTPEKAPNLLKLDKLRHYQVRTHNSLIQNTSFRLSTSQQKIILHLIQRISNKTTNLKFRFSINDYEDFLGVKHDSRNTYDIKQSLKDLADKSFWIRSKDVDADHPSDEYDDLVRWFSHVRYNRTRNYFEIQFDDRLKPFLLDIKSNFTSFDYHNVIGMRRSYSIRLYQIFVSHYNDQNRNYGYKYTINKIRFLLGIKRGKYKRFADLNRRVIQPSLREMNSKTSFNFFYCLIKNGRKTVGIRVLLRKKSNHQQRQAIDNVDRKLLSNNDKKLQDRYKKHLNDNKMSKGERDFRKDIKKFHRKKAAKEKLHDEKEFSRSKEAARRRRFQDAEHKKKRYQRYYHKYNE